MGQQVTEWDAQGNPLPAGGSGPMEWDADGKPLSAQPAAPVGGDLRPLTEQEQLETTYPVGAKGEALGENIHNSLRDAFTGAYGVVRHPLNALGSLVSGLVPGTSTPNPIQSTYEGLNTRPGETLSTMAGQAAVLDPAAKLAPTALEASGKGLKSLGGQVSDVTALGSNPLDRRFGASPGKGLSENRIVGATKAGLKAKVDAAIPKVAAERNAILQRSTAGPQDITADVDRPFDAVSARISNPKTGVADPAEVQALTRARAAITFQQDPLTGKPIPSGPGEGPVPRDLAHMSPAEIAEFNSNLRAMTSYSGKDSPVVDQALKGAGHTLREKLNTVAPEAADKTGQLYNTETAQDILTRQLPANAGGTLVTPSTTLAGMVKSAAAPVMRGAGTAAGAGLDVVGSGMKTLASKLRAAPPPGPPPAGATAMTVSTRPPAPTGPPVAPAPQPEMPSPGSAGGLPQTAGMDMAMPHPQAPPNVTLTERIAPRMSDRNPLDRAGTPPLGSNVGVQGEGFVISPRRLTPKAGVTPRSIKFPSKVSQNPADYPEVNAEGLGRADEGADQRRPTAQQQRAVTKLINKVRGKKEPTQ